MIRAQRDPAWARSVQRFAFKFFGPPQLGDPNEPAPPVPETDPDCPVCRQPVSRHQTAVTAGGLQRIYCG